MGWTNVLNLLTPESHDEYPPTEYESDISFTEHDEQYESDTSCTEHKEQYPLQD